MHPTVKALLSQLGGCGLSFILARSGLLPLTPWWLITCQAVSAASISVILRSRRWWVFIHLAFAPALMLAQHFALSPLWYMGGFVLLLLTYGRSFQTQVPLYLTNTATADAIADLIPHKSRIQLLDLGAGTGSLVRYLADKRRNSLFTGIESAPAPWLIGYCLGHKISNLMWLRGNFFTLSWQGYDIVYAFLSPSPMQQVWTKARQDMRSGSLFISNSFPVSDTSPERILDIPDHRQTRLYIYRIPHKD